jgi:molybdate transport repressor ModE-like protein
VKEHELLPRFRVLRRGTIALSERGGKNGGGMKLTKTGVEALRLYQKMDSAVPKPAITSVDSECGRNVAVGPVAAGCNQ